MLKTYARLGNAAKNAAEKLDSSHKENGKFLFALRCEYLEGRASGSIPASKTFSKFHRDVVGADPHNKAESCANAIAGYVESKLITEADYDDNSNEAVMQASSIFTKADDKTDHPAVVEAAALLKRRPEGVLKKLKAIRERFVKQTVGEGDDAKEETIFLSADELAERENMISPMDAVQMAESLVSKGHVGALLASVLALAQTTPDAEVAEAIVREVVKVGPAIQANKDEKGARRFSDALLEKWRKAALPGPVIVTEDDEKAEYLAKLERVQELESKYADKVADWVGFVAPGVAKA
jgi:hypothetical protein